MKVYEIAEVDSKIGTVKVNKGPLKGFIFDPLGDGRIKVTAPDGTSMTATSQADAEKKAKKHVRTTTPDTSKSKEPKLDRNIKTDVKDIDGSKEPKLTDPDKPKAPAGSFPKGTPTMDQLSGYQQRKLGAEPTSGLKPRKFKLIKRTGKVEYKGKTYTLAQVKAATAADDAAKAATQATQGVFGKTTGLAKSLTGRLIKLLSFPGVGFILSNVWNATQVEEAFDAYLREIQNHAKTLKPEERAEFVKNLINQETGMLPFKVEGAYLRCLEKVAEFLFEMVVAALVAAAALSGKVGVAAIIGLIFPVATTAWITVPVGVIIGATYIVGGTAAIEKVVDALGGMDYIEDWIAPVINPKAVVSLANQTDALQEIFGLKLDALNLIPGLSLAIPSGDLVRDVAKNESTLQEKQLSSADAKRKVLALVKSDPDVQDAYLAGKDEAKKVVKGNLKSLKKLTGEAT